MVILIIPNAMMLSEDIDQKFPELSFETPEASIESFEDYYSNNFGTKPKLVDAYLNLKLNYLGDSPLPNKVLLGKDGWYFLGNNSRDLFDDSSGNHSFSISELEEIKNAVAFFRDTLKSKGIEFHIVVPPNKHRVYSEKLPYNLNQKPTRLQELNTYLKQKINFEILDLRDTLINNKDKEILYYKTNTHWNDLGAYIAYRKTLNSFKLNIPIDSLSNYNYELQPIDRSDITEMINLEFKEKAMFLKRKSESNIETVFRKRFKLHFKNPKGDKKMILYHDSFAYHWIKHFNESFAETVYLRGYKMNLKYILNQKPDVIVIEVVERNLGHILLQLKERSSNF